MDKTRLESDLGRLILNLNPYTNRKIPYTEPLQKTGGMDPYADHVAGRSEGDESRSDTHEHRRIEVEADGPYRQEWTFKGEPQKVGMAYRIKYRFPVYKDGKEETPLYYVEDYMLIGFEGSMGG